MILDRVKDHVVYHIARRATAKEMWDALCMLYQGSSKKRKMYLEQKMRSTQMQKGECVDPFLTKLYKTNDELLTMESTPQESELFILALNSILDEWQVFVYSILGRMTLLNWDEMRSSLKQEDFRRDLVKCKINRSSINGLKPKEEEDNESFPYKGQ